MSAVGEKNSSPRRSVAGSLTGNRGPQEAFKLLTPHGMLQLAKRLGLDLPNAFSRDLEDPSHLFQGVRIPITQSIPQPHDLSLAVGERFEQPFDLVTQNAIARVLDGIIRRHILNELAETKV